MASDEVPAATAASGSSPLERLASFRFTYVAIFLFVLLSVSTLVLAQSLLQRHFQLTLIEAATPDPERVGWVDEIQERVATELDSSLWIRLGGVRVLAIVLGADGRRLIYPRTQLGDAAPTPIPPDEVALPLGVNVEVVLPIDSLLASGILVAYFAVLVSTLVVYTRRLTRREELRLDAVMTAREAAAARAQGIERELTAVRERLHQVEPEHETQSAEIQELEQERRGLLNRLAEVERRESSLRETVATQSGSLQQEQEALEELLDEAMADVQQKEQEIETLQREVKRAAKGPGSSRSREADQLSRRLRTLYKNAEIEDRAIQDLVALRDGTMQLKAEEALKRLSDEPETAAVRRKVGGLPPHLSIFELGFAGKGRIYYTRGRQRRYRILSVGAKNTQKTDLEYLSRLPRE